MVYDTTSLSSFEDIEKFWINEVESYAEKHVKLLLIGNKSDLVEENQVSFEMAQAYAEKRHMIHFLASAKTATKVNESFLTVSKSLITYRDSQALPEKSLHRPKNTLHTPQRPSSNQSQCC